MRFAAAMFVFALHAPAPFQAAETTPVDAACHAAMAPYYAALLTSARGDGDGTLRHLIVLESRWSEVVRRSGANAPDWVRDQVNGQGLPAAVTGRIEAARRQLPRDVAAAHVEIEGIRTLLRDARSRHGARTIDDDVTDYHEAMERLLSHAGESNEISLTAADFTSIKEDAAHARTAWNRVEPGLQKGLAGSTDAITSTRSLLMKIAAAADAHDAAATQQAARDLKARYFDLLGLLSRRG